jgi:hypothetical protein
MRGGGGRARFYYAPPQGKRYPPRSGGAGRNSSPMPQRASSCKVRALHGGHAWRACATAHAGGEPALPSLPLHTACTAPYLLHLETAGPHVPPQKARGLHGAGQNEERGATGHKRLAVPAAHRGEPLCKREGQRGGGLQPPGSRHKGGHVVGAGLASPIQHNGARGGRHQRDKQAQAHHGAQAAPGALAKASAAGARGVLCPPRGLAPRPRGVTRLRAVAGAAVASCN